MSTEVTENQSKKADLVAYETTRKVWINYEKAALEIIKQIGNIWYDKSVELLIFRKQLLDKSASEILSYHSYARNVVKKPITVEDTLLITTEISKLDLVPSRIDIGKLTWQWIEEKGKYNDNVEVFVADKLQAHINDGTGKHNLAPKDVVLYGFGRIGRLAARELIAQAGKGEQVRLRAIVTRSNSDEDIYKRAALLRTDSVHGPFPGTITEDLENKCLIINGQTVHMIEASDPANVDYEAYGINNALIIDNTGIARDRDGLSKHLQSKGVDKVLLTAPGKGDIPNIVHGVNHEKFAPNSDRIFSAASCTTNAIIPPLKVVNDTLGIESGHIETIHSYTNDQNLLDNYHKKYRRGRSAPLNMVITETGAGKAVLKVLPEIGDKLTANAVRVPTPDGSLAILHLTVGKKTTREEVNEIMRDAALTGDLVEQIQFAYSNELVSTDIIGNHCACVFDSQATIVSNDGKQITLYSWYDNEYGYTRQVLRLAKYLSEVVRVRYY